jgi:hypothetical protein
MPDQKYTPLRDEEDGEEHAPHSKISTTGRLKKLNVGGLIINAIVFTIGLIVGSFLSNALRRGSHDQFKQYSMVPCMSAVFSTSS